MVTKAAKSPTGQKPLQESFEDKHERRLEFHEILRSRYNITSCRQDNPSWGREQERQGQSPRHQEFFRRRHLWAVDGEEKRVRSPPRARNYVKYSPVNQRAEYQSINKDQESSADNQFSWRHNRSRTYPLDCTNETQGTLNNNHPLESVYDRINKREVSHRHRGVQTVQGPPRICIKRDSSQQTDCTTAVLNGELVQLSEYLMEALQREQKLKKKLCILQELLHALIQASDKSWKAQLDEDKLKCKVSDLENQLFIYSQNYSKTSVKKILLEMEEQKQRYEQKAKESLQKLTEEKLTTERHLQNTQVSLAVSVGECELWKEEYERLKTDWSELTSKHCELKSEVHILQSKLQWVETKDSQFQQLQNRLQTMERENIELQAWNELLQEDNEHKKEQLDSLKVSLRNAEEMKLEMQMKIIDLQNEVLSLKRRTSPSLTQDTRRLSLTHAPDCQLQNDTLHLVEEKLTAKERECAELQSEVDNLTEEYMTSQRKLQQCREEMKGSHRHKPKKRCSCWTALFILILSVIIMFIFFNNVEYVTH
ncbi:TRAF3-interacting JNK-activating modulator [Rhinophrynus dorsalis]